MAKKTKNIISRREIAAELIRENNEQLLFSSVIGTLILLIFIPLIVMGLSNRATIFNNVFLYRTIIILVFAPFPGIVILLFANLCIGRYRLSRGEYEITTKTLLYKEQKTRKRSRKPSNILHFNNFKGYEVEKNPYLLATSGDKYYLVHFKNSNRILRAYSANTHEIK